MNCYFQHARIELDQKETRTLKISEAFRFILFKVALDMANDSHRTIVVVDTRGSKFPVHAKDDFEDFKEVIKSKRVPGRSH